MLTRDKCKLYIKQHCDPGTDGIWKVKVNLTPVLTSFSVLSFVVAETSRLLEHSTPGKEGDAPDAGIAHAYRALFVPKMYVQKRVFIVPRVCFTSRQWDTDCFVFKSRGFAFALFHHVGEVCIRLQVHVPDRKRTFSTAGCACGC